MYTMRLDIRKINYEHVATSVYLTACNRMYATKCIARVISAVSPLINWIRRASAVMGTYIRKMYVAMRRLVRRWTLWAQAFHYIDANHDALEEEEAVAAAKGCMEETDGTWSRKRNASCSIQWQCAAAMTIMRHVHKTVGRTVYGHFLRL